MGKVRVLVLRAAGINCDEEVLHCWQAAGASPTLIHLNALEKQPTLLNGTDVLTIPGGFSYGDDLGAGTIFAQRLASTLAEPVARLVERGGGVLGICNGFQILVKAGLLPGPAIGNAPIPNATVTYNASARFEARWVKLQVATDRCPFLEAGAMMEMPVEHAEGRVVLDSDKGAERLKNAGRIALQYVDDAGRHDRYPANPNGSIAGIAGLCDATGRILGLMPHPDRNFHPTHHPQWTSRDLSGPSDGMALFRRAVEHWRASTTKGGI